MLKMSFKGWIWPENPEKMEQVYLREPVYVQNEQKVWVFNGMGPLKRTIRGEGTFYGEDAFSQFRMMALLFDKTTSGELRHPIWGVVQVYLTELEMTQGPGENVISYRFTFREADENDEIPK